MKRILALAVSLLVAGSLAACTGGTALSGPDAEETLAQTGTGQQRPGGTPWWGRDYSGETGKTALELVHKKWPVALSGEDETAYVVSIDGLAADPDYNEFWALYVDGERATVSAGALETQDGQEITWRLENR